MNSPAPLPAALFDPKSVVVVGASQNPANRGGQALSLLRKFGYRGDVVGVHPSGRPVHGYPTVSRVDELDTAPELALVAVGAHRVPAAIDQLGAAGVRAAIVWAAGFAEAGEAGRQLQRELQQAAARAGVRVLGPNCLGLVNTAARFCGTFAAWLRGTDELLAGHIAMVTHSGGLGAGAHAMAQAAGVGFRYLVSTGNEADITVVDVLDTLAGDAGTHVLCAYLEGVPDGRRLLAALARARANGKDVVVLKGGRSAASARAVAAHTGALAGQGRVWDAMLDAAGAVQVFSLDELVDVAATLAAAHGKPAPAGRRVAILGYGGGSGVLAADQCAGAGLEVPPLSGRLRAALAPLVPAIAATGNPVDLTPEAANREEYLDRLPEVLDTLDAADEVDVLLLQGGALAHGSVPVARAMADFVRRSRTPAAVYWPSAPAEVAAVFRGAAVRYFAHQQQAASALGRIAARRPATPPPDGTVQPRTVPVPAVGDGAVLAESDVHALLRAAGLPTLRGDLATGAEAAAAIAAALGGPVAMKVVSTQVTHRAAAGLVRLAVPAGQAAATYTELAAAAAAQGAGVLGVYVQEMGPPGAEFLVSAMVDPSFGVIVSCGAGGVLTELLDDVTFGLAPLTREAAAAMVRRLRIAGHLHRTGRAGVLDPLAAFIADLSRLAAGLPWARFILEVNPVLATASRAVAVDGLVVVERAEHR